MKTFTLALGLFFAPLASAAPVFYGSCAFEGQYASGCIEFYDGVWTAESTQQFCESQSKEGSTPILSADFCAKANYNTLCAAVKEDGSVANFYVNNLPSFICKKYMSGVLTKRPVDGWPVPTTPTPGS